VERITPENSEPEIQGSGGWCWYLPRIWRRSKKLVAVAWIATRYSLGEGFGEGRVETVRSCGPWVGGYFRDGDGKVGSLGYLEVFFHLDSAHVGWNTGSE